MELAGLDVDSLAQLLTRSATYGSLAGVAKLVQNMGALGEAIDKPNTPRRRYDGRPASGPLLPTVYLPAYAAELTITTCPR